MKTLNFKIRDSISRDGKLRILINPSHKNYMDADFAFRRNQLVKAETDPDRYFIEPICVFSFLTYDILNKKRDTDFKVFLKAKAVVIHELTHYLQETNNVPYIDPNANNLLEYTSQSSEFEAYTVMAYFFLEEYDKKALKKIMHFKIDMHRKCELVINAYQKIIYPARPLIFGDE